MKMSTSWSAERIPVLQCHPGLCSSTQFDTIQQALPRERPRNQNLLKVPQTSELKNYIQVQYPKRTKGFSTSQKVTLKKTGKNARNNFWAPGLAFVELYASRKGGVKSWCLLQGSFGFQKGIRFENLRSVWVFFWKKSLSPLLNNFKYISVGLFLSSLGLGISPYLHRSLHRPQSTESAPFFGDNASLASVGLLRPLITAEWPTIARKHHAFGMPNGS